MMRKKKKIMNSKQKHEARNIHVYSHLGVRTGVANAPPGLAAEGER